MTERPSRRLNPSLAISIAALVVASSGGAFAAGSAINGRTIQNGTISLAKLAPSLQKQIQHPTISTVITTGSLFATCPSGYAATGGGYSAPGGQVVQSEPIPRNIFLPRPYLSHNGWVAVAPGNAPITVYALCAKVAG